MRLGQLRSRPYRNRLTLINVTALRASVTKRLRFDTADTSWHALSHARFRTYFFISSVSNLGTWLQNTAQMLLAYKLTHSAFGVGIVLCAQFGGFLTIGPWAGALAERIGRKRVLIGTQVISAAVAASLAIVMRSGRLTELELVLGALGIGLALTFAVPVQTTLVADLVPQRDRKAALAMNSVSYNAGRAMAPLLYLAVLFTIGTGWAFMLNALTFLAFAAALWFIFPAASAARMQHPPRARDGLRVALERPRILLMLAMVAAVTIADDPIAVLGPSLAHHLGMSRVWPVFFLSALGIGTLVGAAFPPNPIETRPDADPKNGRRPVPAEARYASFALATLAVSVVIFAAGISPAVSVIAAIVAGVAGLLTGAAAQALLLKTAGPRFAMSVMALWGIAWAGPKPIASFFDGLLAGHIGLLPTAAILAFPAFLLAGLEIGLKEPTKLRAKAFMGRRFQPSPATTWQTALPPHDVAEPVAAPASSGANLDT
jgi:MFS family permease